MRVKINSSMIQMGLRWLISDLREFNAIMSEQRLTQGDVLWLSKLISNPKHLKAVDALPVSLYRVHYDTLKVGRGYLDDDEFREIGNKMVMFMEFCHFARVNEIAPILSTGFDDVGYRVFEAGSFDARMMLVSRGGFSIGTRCNLRRLRTNINSPEDQLSDVTTVLLGDLKHFDKPGVVGIGRIKDYPSTMPPDVIASEMLHNKIQPKLVATWTGLDPEEVVRMKRSLMRDTPLVQSQSGRIQLPNKTLKESPLHSLLYLTVYRLLADEPLKRTNARAIIAAHKEYTQLCKAVGITQNDMILPSNAYQLSNSLRSGDITLTSCSKCKEIYARYTLKPGKCYWCGK
ncbi:FlhC family transcriptional regulator [Pseudomonas sp. 2FE]|uniref:FlhC family transcriptional regulator n=1 Tax=Pseudomonas sp. 2FE TaxID=2502190 RepID=UPI0010F50D50|nr:FlhC family transcriptional regulator [Pseudomonas sp. 2FE]